MVKRGEKGKKDDFRQTEIGGKTKKKKRRKQYSPERQKHSKTAHSQKN